MSGAVRTNTSEGTDHRVVVAMDAEDHDLFFSPGGLGEGWAWFDPGQPDSAWEETLARWNPEVLVAAWSTPALPIEWLKNPACRLRYVCVVTGSVSHVVPRAFLERGGLVTNWGDAATASVAEQALLLTLGALRSAPRWRDAINRTIPLDALRTKPLRGQRVGLHGFGRIAVRLARLLQPFDVELRAFSAGVPAEIFARERVTPAASLEELFAWSDVLIECEALTPTTKGVVSAAVLARLRDDAVFVNVGRGRVVDEDALVREARAGRIRIATDVMTHEPVTAASPLCQVPGVLVSPHIGGPTYAEIAQLGGAARENVRRYLDGRPVNSVVTLEIFDRST
jgi:phosphoglycerate dehydrogenase-like enzyme